MKKLLIIPAILLLASCGSNGGATGLSTSAPASTSGQSTSKTTPPGPTIADITLNVTVSGIETYEDTHTHIWINCDALGTSSTWESAILTQDSTNVNKWSIVLKDFELEQSISYNFYYGTESSPDWTNGKNVSESEYFTLVTEEGKTSYDLTATFDVPEVTGKVDIKFSVSPLIMESATDTGKDISEGNHIWAWNNLDNNTVKLEKDADGSWYFAKSDVELLEGVAKVQLTCVLGSEYAANWDYKQGEWQSGSWVPFNNGISFEFTKDVTEHKENVYFNGEPEVVKGPTLTINFFEDAESEIWPGSKWLEYADSDYTLAEGTWAVDFAWDNEINGYKAVFQFSASEVYLNVSAWSDSEIGVGNAAGKPFHVTFSGETASVSITAKFLAGTYAVVGAVSDAVNCVVE